MRLECQELGLAFDNIKDRMLAENVANGELGDKLAGWPAWIQNVKYPNCPGCGRRMAHVFQVDSEGHVPFMFGDAGCARITHVLDISLDLGHEVVRRLDLPHVQCGPQGAGQSAGDPGNDVIEGETPGTPEL